MGWEFDWLYGIQTIHNWILDRIMVFLSVAGNAGILWIIIGILLLVTKKYRKIGIQTLIAMTITFIIGNLILKNAIARERPCWIDPTVFLLIENPTDYSFPSGHSMNGFTAAVTIFCNDKKLGLSAIILASLIAFSRLYNFVHFPTDVFAGILVGSTVAVLVWLVFQKVDAAREKKQQYKA